MDFIPSRQPTREIAASLPTADALGFDEAERDADLLLAESGWVERAQRVESWNEATRRRDDGYLERLLWPVTAEERKILLGRTKNAAADAPIDLGHSPLLREQLLRFPSAPLYSLLPVSGRDSFTPSCLHTMRLLRRWDYDDAPTRIYLFHNGLNELPSIEFYYRLAGWLLANDPTAACLLRPFPGHLTRFPFNPRLAQQPLDRYLENSSELFRHYLRFMVESQWLLSALAPRARYSTLAGARLLGTRTSIGGSSRHDSQTLAGELVRAFDQMADFNSPAESDEESRSRPTIDADVVRACIDTLRQVIGWQATNDDPPGAKPDGPVVHAIGYSLGGFIAQSVFMAWPYAVASCTTICSGGALREISPVEFANEEEWQSLVHSLRYWMDELLSANLNGRHPFGFPCGIPSVLFEYLLRTFYEIFQRDDIVAFGTRVSEYVRRMLYVVGGNDPIVRPEVVLKSAPDGGANLVSVADLSHFLGSSRGSKSKLEHEQRRFWLPEVARIVTDFAADAEDDFQATLRQGWRDWDNDAFTTRRKFKPQPALSEESLLIEVGDDGALGWPLFDQFLESLILHSQVNSGWLFVMRNEIPSFMLPLEYRIHRAKALHHSDDRIRSYIERVEWREQALRSMLRGVIIILPNDALDKLDRTYQPNTAPATSELPMGEFLVSGLPTSNELRVAAKDHFASTWLTEGSMESGSVWQFRPSSLKVQTGVDASVEGVANPAIAKEASVHNAMTDVASHLRLGVGRPIRVARLPDCWLYVSGDVMSLNNPAADFEKPFERPEDDLRPQAVSQLLLNVARRAASEPFDRLRNANETTLLPRQIRMDMVRLLTVARPRHNPRYRGNVVVYQKEIRKILGHAGLSCALASPWPQVEGTA